MAEGLMDARRSWGATRGAASSAVLLVRRRCVDLLLVTACLCRG
ncbi:hypothetical protein [Saccharopolyspora soli]|nr:hypothetical protein [Saccharopolyspora soli]